MPLSGDAKKEWRRQDYKKKKVAKKMGVEADVEMSGEQAAADFEACKALDAASQRAPGEFHTYEDLCKIFYGSCHIKPFAHEICGKKRSLFDWIGLRHRGRRDLWFLAETLGHQGLKEKTHRPIIDFFVKKDNTSLPIDYTNEQLKECLLIQDVQHDRLLLYPRGFYKSTLMMVDAVQWNINFPDIVMLSVSSIIKLSNSFVKEYRSYFSVKDFENPTWGSPSGDFKLLYPDFCIADGDGDKRSFQCPMAHLDMRNPTLSSSSMESSTAGNRAHVIKFDDSQDEHNYQMVESRKKVRETYDAVRELVIRPYGFVDVGGTRWTDGNIGDDFVDGKQVAVPDLYGTILQRNEQSDEKDLKVLVGAAWGVLPSGQGKSIKELKEEDVDLLFPDGQGAFKILRKKLLENEELFRCNQLNEPAAKTDVETYVNHFNEDLLRKCYINFAEIPPIGKDYVFVDSANSLRKQADYSVVIAYRIVEKADEDPTAYLMSCKFGHWTNSELAQNIVAFCKRWNPICTFIEELPTTSDLFKKGIQEQKRLQGTSDFQIQWFKPDPQAKAKEIRVKGVEMLATSGRWKICLGFGTDSALWLDELMKQFMQFTGHKTTKGHVSGRHDDIPDCAGFVGKVMPMSNRTPEDTAMQKRLKEKADRERMWRIIRGEEAGSRPLTGGFGGVPMEEGAISPIHDALRPLNRSSSGPPISFPKRVQILILFVLFMLKGC